MTLKFFTARGCGVCHEKAPLVGDLAAAEGLPLEELDVESNGAAEAAERRVRTVPTLALADGPRTRFRLVGRMITAENVRHLLAQTQGHTPSAGTPSPGAGGLPGG